MSDDVELALSTTDSIMEIDVLEKCGAFMRQTQRQPAEAIKLLVESYRGYGEMNNLVMSWLQLVGHDQAAVQTTAMAHLSHLVCDGFDSDLADDVLKRDPPPDWINDVITDKAWHDTLLELAKTHPSSLLLKFMVSRVQALAAAESGADGGSVDLNSSFSTYSRLFHTKLVELLEHSGVRAYPGDWQHERREKLMTFCCQGQAAYLYAQRVLHQLQSSQAHTSSSPPSSPPFGPSSSPFLRRFSQDLSRRVRQTQPEEAIDLLDYYAFDRGRNPQIGQFILGCARKQRVTALDASKLYSVFSGDHPPAAEVLREPMVMELLIKTLFTPNTAKVPKESTTHLLFLLACGSLTRIDASEGASVDPVQLQKVVAALSAVQAVCKSKSFGTKPLETNTIFRQHMHLPVVSAGIVHWLSAQMPKAAYYETTYHGTTTPMYICLLAAVASTHTLLLPRVFDVVRGSFQLQGIMTPVRLLDYKRDLLRVYVHLILLGLVEPVLGEMQKVFPNLDHALVRYFLGELLSATEAPYSPIYLRLLLGLVALPVCMSALTTNVAQQLSSGKRGRTDEKAIHPLPLVKALAQHVLGQPDLIRSAEFRPYEQALNRFLAVSAPKGVD